MTHRERGVRSVAGGVAPVVALDLLWREHAAHDGAIDVIGAAARLAVPFVILVAPVLKLATVDTNHAASNLAAQPDFVQRALHGWTCPESAV